MPSDPEIQLHNFYPAGGEAEAAEESEGGEEIFEEDDDEDGEDSDSPSTSSDPPTATATATTSQALVPITTTTTTAAAAIIIPSPNLQTPQSEKKPSALDDSRRLFQRLWTDEDEVALLRGFLDYRTQRGGANHPSYHIDTGMFYDQIKHSLQFDFNKNQLVDKLRRLKKKYRNAISRITSGKEFSFKTPHDQTTFEIAHKIWGGVGGSASIHEVEEDNEQKPHITEIREIKNESVNVNGGVSVNNSDIKDARVPKRAREEENLPNLGNISDKAKNFASTNLIEDTIRSCLSPLLKELLSCSANGFCNFGGLGGIESSPFPLNFGVKSSGNSEAVDEKWRKQQILELEVYSRRMELVQDQIKSALEELRSASS